MDKCYEDDDVADEGMKGWGEGWGCPKERVCPKNDCKPVCGPPPTALRSIIGLSLLAIVVDRIIIRMNLIKTREHKITLQWGWAKNKRTGNTQLLGPRKGPPLPKMMDSGN